ncbi:pyridoxamine 5'-phosphate oxidase family protein [Silicimonas algicola]|uniref:Pyridoxamine 5'-phosphate oxidase N-terminal domain-containing protein n=1 Tax=Silicimonas algicola TaxID=1826607 RepID=A0A316G143_9RHOB|nr:pyridoxamine 5'-phosphate oxidase family protein [Silicimonas algicola]AZQ69028.1 pyridoxamine 5'-phosphate oxidase family protein [Silicimonas algicola]PWK54085.1 hypothetical protein C8D95_11273 [Silicimonas algicola]
MTHDIDTIEALEAIYGIPLATAVAKVADRLVPVYREWIAASRFCIFTTVGPEGTDASPRGEDGPVVIEIDERTLALPDWHGNNRVDSLRNIVRDGRVSLLFMVPGSDNVVRVNGTARLTVDPAVLGRFERGAKRPRSVIVVRIGEVYFQCARALLRSKLWSSGDQSAGLPTPGQILAALSDDRHGGEAYDAVWPERARETLW